MVHGAEKWEGCRGITKEGEAIEYLYHQGKAQGAGRTGGRAEEDVLETLRALGREQDVQVIVTGVSSGRG